MRPLIGFVLKQRLLVLAATALLIGVGVWSAMRLPIDAVPDVTNVQVQVNTNAAALSPLEVERQMVGPLAPSPRRPQRQSGGKVRQGLGECRADAAGADDQGVALPVAPALFRRQHRFVQGFGPSRHGA